MSVIWVKPRYYLHCTAGHSSEMAPGSSCLEIWNCGYTKGASTEHHLITGPKYSCIQRFQLENKVCMKRQLVRKTRIHIYITVFSRTILKIPNWTFPFSHASDNVEIDWNDCILWAQRPRTEVWPQNTSICKGQIPLSVRFGLSLSSPPSPTP